MRPFIPIAIILGLLLFSCHESDNKTNPIVREKVSTSSADKEQIQVLIRQALKWADSKNSIRLLPVVTDSKDSIYIGVNLNQHKQNLDKLKATNFFSTGFIDNYNQLVLAINAGMRSGKYEQWLVGDGPTIVFVSGVNAWCLCQDVPYDNPNPWDNIEVSLVKQNKANVELTWRWGKLELNAEPRWKDFSYKVLVTKETGKWKIDYLEGFDFKEGTKEHL